MTSPDPRCLLLAAVLGLSGCAAGGDADRPPSLDAVLGTYAGSFDSALTPDAADDLNHNPCDPARQDCLTHHRPLAGVLLSVERGDDGTVRLEFFTDEAAQRAGRPLDLLGNGCGTQLGPVAESQREVDHWTLRFPLQARNSLCLGKLRPTSDHHVLLHLYPATAASAGRAEVVIDKQVRDANFLYVMEDGVQRRVRIDRDNTVREGQQTQWRVCIENDLGEFERCVLTDREFRSFALPLPVPGGVAMNYTWWYDLSPNLERTRGRYQLEQYVGRFERLDD